MDKIDEILRNSHWQCCNGDYCKQTKEGAEEDLAQAKKQICEEVIGRLPKKFIFFPDFPDELMCPKAPEYANAIRQAYFRGCMNSLGSCQSSIRQAFRQEVKNG